MTVSTADGISVWVFRYASEGPARSLFYFTDIAGLLLPQSSGVVRPGGDLFQPPA
jgi:hypothetical protein